MDSLDGFQRDLLYAVAGMSEPHGPAITEELDGYYETEPNRGRLHPGLDALAETELVDEDRKAKRTNVYTTTSRGESVIEERPEWGRYLPE